MSKKESKKENINFEKKYFKSWRLFLSFYLYYWKWTLLISFISLLSSIIIIFLPFLSQVLSNYVNTQNKISFFFISMAIGMIGINIIKIILDFVIEFLSNHMNFKLEVIWREKLIKKMLNLPIEKFENFTIGAFLSRIVSDLKDMTSFAFNFLSKIIFTFSILLGTFIYINIISYQIGLTVIAYIFLIFIIYILFLKKFIINKQILKVLNTRISTDVAEQVNLISEIKSFNNKKIILDFFNNKQNDYLIKSKKVNFQLAFFKTIGAASNVLLTTIIIIISSYWKIQNEITSAQLIGLTISANMLSTPLINLSLIFTSIVSVTASLTRLNYWLEQQEEENKGILKPKLNGKIEFKNIRFSYKLNNNNETLNVFNNFSFTLEPNQRVQIYGYNPNGKSTLFKLIMKFYNIEEGKILIDNIDINDIELNYLRENISFLQEDPQLFSKNKLIGFYNNKKRLNEIINDLDIEKSFKIKLNNDSFISSQGIQLSQSNKKLICLARTIYINNNIILLDNLDAYLNEKQIEKVNYVLDKYCKDKSVFIITSTSKNIFNANQIINFDNINII